MFIPDRMNMALLAIVSYLFAKGITMSLENTLGNSITSITTGMAKVERLGILREPSGDPRLAAFVQLKFRETGTKRRTTIYFMPRDVEKVEMLKHAMETGSTIYIAILGLKSPIRLLDTLAYMLGFRSYWIKASDVVTLQPVDDTSLKQPV